MEIKFWAGCLAAYNSGNLHGEWITATDDPDEMDEKVKAMLARSPVAGAEEWMVFDWDDPSRVLSPMGETSDLKAIADRVEAIEEIEGDYDERIVPHLLAFASEQVKETYNWKSTIDNAFVTIASDAEDYVAEFYQDTGGLVGVSDELLPYINWRSMARDWAFNGDYLFLDASTGEKLDEEHEMHGIECIVLRVN